MITKVQPAFLNMSFWYANISFSFFICVWTIYCQTFIIKIVKPNFYWGLNNLGRTFLDRPIDSTIKYMHLVIYILFIKNYMTFFTRVNKELFVHTEYYSKYFLDTSHNSVHLMPIRKWHFTHCEYFLLVHACQFSITVHVLTHLFKDNKYKLK